MFRSIRWTLQMWHAAILATVLVAFGCVVFHLMRLTTYKQIDEDLNNVARRVGFSFRPAPLGPGSNGNSPLNTDFQNLANALNSGKLPSAQQAFAQLQKDLQTQTGPGRRPVWGGRFRPRDAGRPETADGKKSALADTNGDGKKEAAARPPGTEAATSVTEAARDTSPRRFDVRFDMPDDLKAMFDGETESGYYYVIWRSDGSAPVKSKFAPDIAEPTAPPEPRPGRREPPGHVIRERGDLREWVAKRWGMTVVVGRSIQNDLAALHEKGWLLAAAGAAVLGAGLLGGRWFSTRAIKPIEAISATAADISLSNLSRRIDVTGTETELTGLARTLNQMFDRLESAFAQQVRFTADASHELRTPLAVILSHTELALGKSRPAEELRETIETCRRSALRMKSLVESLLTLARFDSGELQLEHRSFDISRTASDCVGLVRPLGEQRKISILMDLTPASLTGDPDRIAQVITNLLTNAIRYNHDHGQVVISTRPSDESVILTVSDTGIGIPREHLPHIFERFYRVDRARARKDGGVGLGLAICRSIVEAHGGTIMVTPNAESGTTFEVRLPRDGTSGAPAAVRDVESRRSEISAAHV